MAWRRSIGSGLWGPVAFVVGWTVLVVGEFTGRPLWAALLAPLFLVPSCVAMWRQERKRRLRLHTPRRRPWRGRSPASPPLSPPVRGRRGD